ncbi:MAG: hypothetical protein L3J26_13205 [Candidatus Polarisedimenticolaceae bacterium]|nr:hypothetical protein [Candidatus Polarisedimenticolaceae bacterium]
MSEFLTESKVEYLTDIIRQMCAGNNPEKEVQQFTDHCESLTGDEVTAVFNQLSQENIQYENNDQVINFYHTVIDEKIAAHS